MTADIQKGTVVYTCGRMKLRLHQEYFSDRQMDGGQKGGQKQAGVVVWPWIVSGSWWKVRNGDSATSVVTKNMEGDETSKKNTGASRRGAIRF